MQRLSKTQGLQQRTNPLSAARSRVSGDPIEVSIGGRPRELLFTMDSLAAFEERAVGRRALSVVRALVWSMLRDPSISVDQVGRWIGFDDFGRMGAAVNSVLERCLSSLPDAHSSATVDAPAPEAPLPVQARDWDVIWSFAVYTLRIDSDTFWSLTPRQFEAITARWEDDLERTVGVVCATLCNINRNEEKQPRPFMPSDFVPGRAKKPGPRTVEEKRQAMNAMRAKIEMLNAALGGIDKRKREVPHGV